MTYINTETVSVSKLTCSHPAVEHFWEWGALSVHPTSEAQLFIGIILFDGTRYDFHNEIPEKAIEEAEIFLQSLPLLNTRKTPKA